MCEKDFNQLFSKRLRHYLDISGMTQAELASKLGVGTTSVYNWANGIKTPRMDKVDKMCAIFHIRREDLLTDIRRYDETTIPIVASTKEQAYYSNPETAKVAQEIFDNSDLRILFDAARDSTPEQLKLAAEMLRQFKKTAGEE